MPWRQLDLLPPSAMCCLRLSSGCCHFVVSVRFFWPKHKTRAALCNEWRSPAQLNSTRRAQAAQLGYANSTHTHIYIHITYIQIPIEDDTVLRPAWGWARDIK